MTDLRAQLSKLAEMQGNDERPVMTAFNFKDCLAEFDRLSEIEAAARELNTRWKACARLCMAQPLDLKVLYAEEEAEIAASHALDAALNAKGQP